MAQKPKKPSSPFAVLKDVELAPPKPAKAAPAAGQGKRSASSQASAKSSSTQPASAPAAVDPAQRARDYDERMAIKRAYAGVQRMGDASTPKVVQPAVRSAEEVASQVQRDAEARARLDAFVGGAKRFVIDHDGDEVRGRRDDVSPAQAAQLFQRVPAPSIGFSCAANSRDGPRNGARSTRSNQP